MARDLTLEDFVEGEQLSASKLNKVKNAIQQMQGFQGGFVSSNLALTRKTGSNFPLSQAAAGTANAIGLVLDTIPAIDDVPDLTGKEPHEYIIVPGRAGPPADRTSSFGEAGSEPTRWDQITGVILLDWRKIYDPEDLSTYFDTDVYDHSALAPIVERFGDGSLHRGGGLGGEDGEGTGGGYSNGGGGRYLMAEPFYDYAWRQGVNVSGTEIRASEAEPVVVQGYQYTTIDPEGGVNVWFMICNIFDMRSLPGYERGTIDPEDPGEGLQIPFHLPEEIGFKLDATKCEPPEEEA